MSVTNKLCRCGVNLNYIAATDQYICPQCGKTYSTEDADSLGTGREKVKKSGNGNCIACEKKPVKSRGLCGACLSMMYNKKMTMEQVIEARKEKAARQGKAGPGKRKRKAGSQGKPSAPARVKVQPEGDDVQCCFYFASMEDAQKVLRVGFVPKSALWCIGEQPPAGYEALPVTVMIRKGE
jgi:hypothetical protein